MSSKGWVCPNKWHHQATGTTSVQGGQHLELGQVSSSHVRPDHGSRTQSLGKDLGPDFILRGEPSSWVGSKNVPLDKD